MNDSVVFLWNCEWLWKEPVRSRRKSAEPAEVYSKCWKWLPLANTCTQPPSTPLINGFVDHALWNRWRNGDTSFTPQWDIARWSKFTGGSV